jgi:hypothetical protein
MQKASPIILFKKKSLNLGLCFIERERREAMALNQFLWKAKNGAFFHRDYCMTPVVQRNDIFDFTKFLTPNCNLIDRPKFSFENVNNRPR